jgi:hypothetical protein
LLIKSFWWAAWWPVSTWLLTLEKSVRQRQTDNEPQPLGDAFEREWGQESSMANDAFMKPEVPDAFRELMRVSIEQSGRSTPSRRTPCPCSSASAPVSFRNDRNWPPIRLLANDGLTRIAERVRDRPKQSSELPDNPLGLPAVSAIPAQCSAKN